MWVLVYHNEHIGFDTAGDHGVFGPYATFADAQKDLQKLVESMDDPLFKIDPDPEFECSHGDYAGYFYEDLVKDDRDEDLASEIWAEIIEVLPFPYKPKGTLERNDDA